MADGYGVKGKFTSSTGVSGAKEKGNFKGYGYKGKTKKGPKTTKTYGQVTGDPSKDKSESKAASTSDLTQYVKDEETYEKAVAEQEAISKPDGYDDATGQFFLQGKPVGTTATDYAIAQGAAGIETDEQKMLKAKAKEASVADLQAEADINTALNAEEFRATEESYLTNYSGTAGDSYYKNEEGTGTGQGGSGTGFGTGSNTYTYTGNDKTTDTVTPKTTKKDEDTPTTTTVDMSSDGDENKPSKATSATNTGGGGGTATDMEEIAELPQKLKSAYRRRAKRRGKRDLRVQKDTGLNVPASSSGLSIPT